jgi:hypothetical protein
MAEQEEVATGGCLEIMELTITFIQTRTDFIK